MLRLPPLDPEELEELAMWDAASDQDLEALEAEWAAERDLDPEDLYGATPRSA